MENFGRQFFGKGKGKAEEAGADGERLNLTNIAQ